MNYPLQLYQHQNWPKSSSQPTNEVKRAMIGTQWQKSWIHQFQKQKHLAFLYDYEETGVHNQEDYSFSA